MHCCSLYTKFHYFNHPTIHCSAILSSSYPGIAENRPQNWLPDYPTHNPIMQCSSVCYCYWPDATFVWKREYQNTLHGFLGELKQWTHIPEAYLVSLSACNWAIPELVWHGLNGQFLKEAPIKTFKKTQKILAKKLKLLFTRHIFIEEKQIPQNTWYPQYFCRFWTCIWWTSDNL